MHSRLLVRFADSYDLYVCIAGCWFVLPILMTVVVCMHSRFVLLILVIASFCSSGCDTVQCRELVVFGRRCKGVVLINLGISV